MAYMYKGKGDAVEFSSYHDIKLYDYVMKVLERVAVVEVKIRNKVNIDRSRI